MARIAPAAQRHSRRRCVRTAWQQATASSGYLPNIPEAVIAFLATASIGAIWSACGQDYSAKAALDRFGQLEPVVLFTADGYRYGGKTHDQRDDVAALRAGLPTLRATVLGIRAHRREADDRSICDDGPPSTSTIRCGCCSRPARRDCRRASCTGTAASCSNT